MTDYALLSIMKYLKQNNLEESWLSLQQQSHIKLFTYPKQIQFFRKITLKGDFQQCILFMTTFQLHLGQKVFKNACLSIYKQKLYQLINVPDQKQLKNLFQKQIINYCTQQQFQHLFALLTSRKTQDIPGLSDWTVMKGRLKIFQQLLPLIQSVIYNNKPQNYFTTIQPQINLDQAVAVYLQVINNSKLSQGVVNNNSKLTNNNISSLSNKKSQNINQILNTSGLNPKQVQLQLSQSCYEKSMIGGNFDRKSRVYTNNLSNMPQNQSQKFTKSIQRSGIKQSELHHGHRHEYSGSKLYQQQQIKQISQEQQRSDTVGSNQMIQRSRRSAQLSNRSAQVLSKPQQRIRESGISKKYLQMQNSINKNSSNIPYDQQIINQDSSRQNIQYLQQTNSVVYNNDLDRENQHFTFSHHNFTSQIQKPKRINKLSVISDNKAIRTCQFSSSGSYFAVGTNSSILKIFDVQNLFIQNKYCQIQPIYQIFGLHTKSIFCLDWAKDESSMVTCSNDLTIKLTQFSQSFDSHEVSVIGRHQSCIRMVKYNQQQNKIYSCGDDSLVKVWDMGKVKRCYNLKGHTAGISAFKVCDTNNQLYSVSKDSTIKRWDLRTLECIATSKPQQSQMTFIADNTDRIVASNKNGNVIFFDQDLNVDYEVKIHEQQIRSIEAAKNQDIFITASFDGHVGMFSQKSIHSPDYFQHNQNSQDKVVFATFLDHPQYKGFASTSTLGLCHIYSYF